MLKAFWVIVGTFSVGAIYWYAYWKGEQAGVVSATSPKSAEPSGYQFEVYRSHGQSRWRLRAANNKIVAASCDAYKNHMDCVDMVTQIQDKAQTATIKLPVDKRAKRG